MKNIYIFDMDGTLTPARKPMAKSFAKNFLPFLEKNESYIATGSDFKKVQEQLPSEIFSAFSGFYCSMGNELWQNGEFVYQNSLDLEEALLEKLENYRKNTNYPNAIYPNYIEKRIGMVNFSILGRDCPYGARLLYGDWDKVNLEREMIQAVLGDEYPQYDFSLGGSISIDIVKKGCGKEQIGADLRGKNPHAKLVFYGDKTFVGGNDYELASYLLTLEHTEVIQVDSPDDLLEKLGL